MTISGKLVTIRSFRKIAKIENFTQLLLITFLLNKSNFGIQRASYIPEMSQKIASHVQHLIIPRSGSVTWRKIIDGKSFSERDSPMTVARDQSFKIVKKQVGIGLSEQNASFAQKRKQDKIRRIKPASRVEAFRKLKGDELRKYFLRSNAVI